MKKIALAALFCGCLSIGSTVFAASMAIDSLSGPVTQNEINSFNAFMQTQTPPSTPWGSYHNEYADGVAGRDVDAMGMMYEVSGNIQILDRMIYFVDIFVSTRNDLLSASKGGQRVMWTGLIDKVWCPESPTNAHAKYSGSETEDVIERIAYCAKQILQTPSIWNTAVPDGNPHGYGVTYLERAETYIAMCDESNDEYFLKWFVQAGTNLIRPPVNQPGWNAMNENVTANNRQMMFCGGYQRLAECHEILGDNPARVAQYDAVVKASVTECLASMMTYGTHVVSGHTVYKWAYFPINPSGVENVGHGAYDMVGMYRAYSRGTYGASLADVTPLANTLVYVISKRGNNFSGNVDGSGGSQNNMLGEWIPLADWNPTVYTLIATADVASGIAASTPHIDASILWVKNRRNLGATVGTPTFSPVPGTYAGPQTVTISSATPGALIRYTTDGSTPTAYSGTFYAGPVSIGSTSTINAIAYHPGLTNSAIASASYTIGPGEGQTAAPVFTPGGGTYTVAQNVSISSTTGGASFRYTTDGITTPTETVGAIYSGPVSISSTTVLQAVAFKSGMTDSTVTSETYTITIAGPPPTFNFEAASMSPVGTGATVSTSSDPNVSGGLLEFLNSTAAGQSMTLTTPSMPAGTYQVQFRYKTNTSRAQHNVVIDGTQVGGMIDQYATTPTYLTATLGNVTFATAGTHKIVLTVTGKDSAATHFYISADRFTFVGQ
jgi:hypothetical protein